MKRIAQSLILSLAWTTVWTFISFSPLTASVTAQTTPGSPSQVVMNFYRFLHGKRYQEGFRLSVYEGAVTSLSGAELDELKPEFDATFAEIPDVMNIAGEQISGDRAVVFLQLPGKFNPEVINLIKIGNEWRVGDQETYALVKLQGREFFFNVRMYANEHETADTLKQLILDEIIYAQNHNGHLLDLPALVKENINSLPKELAQGASHGYKFDLRITQNGRGFDLTAVPTHYARTGKLSFFANAAGIRAQDLSGQLASVTAPLFQD